MYDMCPFIVSILPGAITHLSKLETPNAHSCGQVFPFSGHLSVYFRSIWLLWMSDLRGSAWSPGQ